MRLLRELLSDCPDIVFKSFLIHGRTCTLIYIPTIIDNMTLQKNIAHILHIESQSESKWDDFRIRLEQGQAFPVQYQKRSITESQNEWHNHGRSP